MPNYRENPEAFLDGLISDPMDMSGFKTEGGSAFVYSAIEDTLGELRPRDAERYVSQLNKKGYNVKWVAPAVIEPIN